MLRWIVLVGSLALWLGCMGAVYWQCKPTKIEGSEEASRMALDRMFAENASERRTWAIYAEPEEINAVRGLMFGGAGEKPLPRPGGVTAKREWNGLNENGLLKAGRLETRVKNKRTYSLDEETTLKLDLPSALLTVNYTGSAHITLDNGLENCSMNMKLGLAGFEIDAMSLGVRENDDLQMTTNVSQKGQTLYNGKRTEKIGGNTALNAELTPFQFNPDVRVGFEWTIVMLDFNLANAGEAQGAKPLKVKCTGNTTIMMNGRPMRAFAVRSEDGKARAWYSPDGVVLKQACQIAGVLEVVLVREE
jgi:hypothetical protein